MIICVTAIALVSVIRGIDGGVKLLSNINMFLAFLLLMFVFFVGPTMQILHDTWTGFITYVG